MQINRHICLHVTENIGVHLSGSEAEVIPVWKRSGIKTWKYGFVSPNKSQQIFFLGPTGV